MSIETAEALRNKTVTEICELVEAQARIIEERQKLIELLTNNMEAKDNA